MSDERRPNTAWDAQDDAPPDLHAIQDRLERDAAAWGAQLPSAERVAARALALAQEPLARLPQAASPDHARQTAPFRQRGQPSMIASRLRIPLAGVAAALVVALLGMLLAGRMHGAPGPASLPAVSASPTATTPATPTPIPQPPFPYLQHVVTAAMVDGANNPIGLTSQFPVGSTVYVTFQVRGAPAGAHSVSVRWFINGAPVPLPQDTHTALTVTGDMNGAFAATFAQSGNGLAQLYWEDSASGTPTQGRLVASLPFYIGQPPVNAPATPTVFPEGAATPTPTPHP